MSWRKIIFADIDGVFNHEEWYNRTRGEKGNFDPEVVKLFNQLKDIGAEVVVSSSWGEDGVKQLKNVGLELPILGTTEKLHYRQEWACRGNEIDKWLTDHFGGMGTKYGLNGEGVPYHRNPGSKDYEYVIFDDDTDMLFGQKDNFIHVSRWVGATQDDIDRARKILNRED